MGLFDAVRAAFGRSRPAVVVQGPLRCTPAASARLAALAEGDGLHIDLVPAEGGFVVRASEGPSQGPPPLGVTLPVTLSDTDLARLAGVELDYVDERWAVTASLTLHARGTPNPNGRLYEADRALARGRPFFVTPERPATGLGGLLLQVTGIRSALLRDNTVTVERDAGASWDDIDPAVDAAIRRWLLLLGEPFDGDSAPDELEGFEAEVMAVITERILPGVHRDGGDIRLVGVANGVAHVAMHGACRSCPSSTATLRFGVERALTEAFPGRIHTVEAV